MSTHDEIIGGDGDKSALVAEYVLGVLDANEHASVAAMIAASPELQREAQFWQLRLSALDSQFEEVTPPAHLLSKVEARLFGAPEKTGLFNGLWSNLGLWRGVTAGALAIAVAAIGFTILQPQPVTPETSQLVATLEAEGSTARFIALYDSASGNVRLNGVAGDVVADQDYELWLIEGENAPISLGVVPVNDRIEVALSEELRAKLAEGVVFAVTLEQKGGSPDGTPKGPVVAAGAATII